MKKTKNFWAQVQTANEQHEVPELRVPINTNTTYCNLSKKAFNLMDEVENLFIKNCSLEYNFKCAETMMTFHVVLMQMDLKNLELEYQLHPNNKTIEARLLKAQEYFLNGPAKFFTIR